MNPSINVYEHTCEHEICQKIHTARYNEMMNDYNKKICHETEFVYEMGKIAVVVVVGDVNQMDNGMNFLLRTMENDQDSCMICYGSSDVSDESCYLKSAIRLLDTEYNLSINIDTFIQHSKHKNEYFIPIVTQDLTPIIYINFTHDEFLSWEKNSKNAEINKKILGEIINKSPIKLGLMNWDPTSNFYLKIRPGILKNANYKSLTAISTMLWSNKFCCEKINPHPLKTTIGVVKPQDLPCADHVVCRNIFSHNQGKMKGVATVVAEEWPSCHDDVKILLGMETKNCNAQKFNICTGSSDIKDGTCYIECACRELWEEFGIKYTTQQFSAYNTDIYGNPCVYMLGSTPIFFLAPPSISLSDQNTLIESRLSDPALGHEFKEIKSLIWSEYLDPSCENNNREYSSITLSVMRIFDLHFTGFKFNRINNLLVVPNLNCRFGKKCQNNDCKLNHYCGFGKCCIFGENCRSVHL